MEWFIIIMLIGCGLLIISGLAFGDSEHQAGAVFVLVGLILIGVPSYSIYCWDAGGISESNFGFTNREICVVKGVVKIDERYIVITKEGDGNYRGMIVEQTYPKGSLVSRKHTVFSGGVRELVLLNPENYKEEAALSKGGQTSQDPVVLEK